jgi:HSP20 family protein
LHLICFLSYTANKTKRQGVSVILTFLGGFTMARRNQRDDDLLLEEDELTAAFLGDDDLGSAAPASAAQPAAPANDDWNDDVSGAVPGTLPVDVFETRERLVIKARTAGVNKSDLDVSISDNQLTIRGTLSAGNEDEVENYFLQECYWGEFSRTIALPVPVKEDDIEAVLKDGVLTISFGKVEQNTIKKIQVL